MITIGFVGVGTISSAVVKGLCSDPSSDQFNFILSPRNQAKAAWLQSSFPTRVRVASSNQQVVDESDWVFIAVLPQQVKLVLSSLKFRENQLLVSLAAGTSTAFLQSLVPNLPLHNIVRAVPLPPVAARRGVTLVYPAHKDISPLFDSLGQAVAAKNELELGKLQTITGMMGSYYQLLQTYMDWLVGHDVNSQVASSYVGAVMESIAHDSHAAGHSHAMLTIV
jgi:pyrroline-5-carboxylate reductase